MEQKIIRAKLGLLELAKQLDNSLPPQKRGSAKPVTGEGPSATS